MGLIAEVQKDNIVRERFNLLVEALLQTLQSNGNLKEPIIEAKHLTQNIDAIAKGFDADKLDGHHWSEIQPKTKISVYRPTNFTIPHATWTIIPFDTELFDANNEWDTSAYMFTATEAGYYLVTFQVNIEATGDVRVLGAVWIENVFSAYCSHRSSVITQEFVNTQKLFYLNIGDRIRGHIFQRNYTGAATANLYPGSALTFMTIHRIV